MEYFIYGIIIPKKTYYDWMMKINPNTLNEIKTNGYIIHEYNGRDGVYFLFGKKIVDKENTNTLNNPIIVPEISDDEKLNIVININKYFSTKQTFHYYFVTN